MTTFNVLRCTFCVRDASKAKRFASSFAHALSCACDRRAEFVESIDIPSDSTKGVDFGRAFDLMADVFETQGEVVLRVSKDREATTIRLAKEGRPKEDELARRLVESASRVDYLRTVLLRVASFFGPDNERLRNFVDQELRRDAALDAVDHKRENLLAIASPDLGFDPASREPLPIEGDVENEKEAIATAARLAIDTLMPTKSIEIHEATIGRRAFRPDHAEVAEAIAHLHAAAGEHERAIVNATSAASIWLRLGLRRRAADLAARWGIDAEACGLDVGVDPDGAVVEAYEALTAVLKRMFWDGQTRKEVDPVVFTVRDARKKLREAFGLEE